MLPKDWQRRALGEIAEISSGGTPDRGEPDYWGGDIPWVTTGEIQFNTILDTTEKITEAGLKHSSAKLFPPATLLMAMYGQGKTRGQVAKLGIPATTNQNSAAILLKQGFDPDFYFHFLSWKYESIRNFGHSGGVSHLNAGLLKQIPVPVISLVEQQQISHALTIWDQAIATMERLLANSRKQKQALMQSLLSGRRRINGRKSTFVRKHTSEVFTPYSVRKNGGLELLSVMQDVGVVPRSQLDRKVVMPDGSTEGYKLVEPGNFVISLRSFEGGLEYSRYTGLVSPAYTVLKPRTAIFDDFYRHYFKSAVFIKRLAVAVIGIRDGKQVSYDDFAFLKLPYPEIGEQREIAEILNAAEKLIHHQQVQVNGLQAEKRALMADLLTGKRRVRLPQSVSGVGV